MARNDYMIEEENNEFYQVEYNLFAASLGPICQGARKVHTLINNMSNSDDCNIPASLDNSTPFIDALKAAHQAYGKEDAIIVNISDYGNNLFDHLFPIEALNEAG